MIDNIPKDGYFVPFSYFTKNGSLPGGSLIRVQCGRCIEKCMADNNGSPENRSDMLRIRCTLPSRSPRYNQLSDGLGELIRPDGRSIYCGNEGLLPKEVKQKFELGLGIKPKYSLD